MHSQTVGISCNAHTIEESRAPLSNLTRPETYEYAGAAIAQGVQYVAEKLILSYTEIKMRAGDLSNRDEKTEGGAAEENVTGDDGVREPGSESDWDLDLALTTVEFNKANLERIRLMGTRCVGFDFRSALTSFGSKLLEIGVCCFSVDESKLLTLLGLVYILITV